MAQCYMSHKIIMWQHLASQFFIYIYIYISFSAALTLTWRGFIFTIGRKLTAVDLMFFMTKTFFLHFSLHGLSYWSFIWNITASEPSMTKLWVSIEVVLKMLKFWGSAQFGDADPPYVIFKNTLNSQLRRQNILPLSRIG